jgi:uncharacterized protein with PQ loop repeat
MEAGRVNGPAVRNRTTGRPVWLTYGITKGEPPIVIANSITLTLAGTILFFKLRYRDQSQAMAPA